MPIRIYPAILEGGQRLTSHHEQKQLAGLWCS